MIGQLCRDSHWQLSSGEDNGIEVGVKFTSYVFGTEEWTDQDDELEHDETFEESHEETASHDDVHAACLCTDQAEENL